MEIVIRAAAAAVIGSILALLLRKYTPELSLTVTMLPFGPGIAPLMRSAFLAASTLTTSRF